MNNQQNIFEIGNVGLHINIARGFKIRNLFDETVFVKGLAPLIHSTSSITQWGATKID